MIYNKRYLQFNNLVFDGYDMIRDFDEETSFKDNLQPYSYGHGSYMPFKNRYMHSEQKSATMTIVLHLKKIPCEYRKFYAQFAEEELSRPGRLWAVKNNEVIWAYAYPKNITPINNNRNDEIEWDVEIIIPEGVWHKADKQKTFVLPYDVCLFMECKGYKEINPCGTGDCCQDCIDNNITIENKDCFCCCVDTICPEMALCYHLNEIQDFYGCETPYQLVYDCDHAEKFSEHGHVGIRLCTEKSCDSDTLSGRFYSETDLPTENVGITIVGEMHNPWITINGNTNIINGDYDGELQIKNSGDIYYQCSECGEPELLNPDVWIIPTENDYGWIINPRGNSMSVNLNKCCTHKTCVYIEHEAITL